MSSKSSSKPSFKSSPKNGVRGMPLEQLNMINNIVKEQRYLLRELERVVRNNRHDNVGIRNIKKRYRELDLRKMRLLRGQR